MDEWSDRYLYALKQALTRGPTPARPTWELRATNWKRRVLSPAQSLLLRRGYRIVSDVDLQSRFSPEAPETMVGVDGLDLVQTCVETILRDEVEGDLIETGVWRGGVVIFMRALLAVHGVTDRTVWAADSFQGFPTIRNYEVDQGEDFTGRLGDSYLAVDLQTVQENFKRYGLLDAQVRFLPGWFSDTLHAAPIEALAILRLDGDLYESTWDALAALEPRVSRGGYVIVDDYGSFEQCRRAVDDYREKCGLDDAIQRVGAAVAYWRKS
jgi:O-methyltransferase